ncbi:MAG: hypothetical protein HYZ53_16305 [Planctomycetes bacterium]|nr:hypothetical protein [Planctomycetota bacterium]
MARPALTAPAGIADLPPDTRAALVDGLEAIYRDLAADVARVGPVCIRRGVCCDFEKQDYVLYATTVELLYLSLHVDLRGVAVAGKRCPFWIGGLCGRHEVRPLGCRVYFCDPRYVPFSQDIYNRHHRKLQELGDRLGIPYEYAPFLSLLERWSGAAKGVRLAHTQP